MDSIRCKNKNWIKLGLMDLSKLSFSLSSFIIDKLGLSLWCLKFFKLVYPIFTAVYIVEWLVLQTIYVLNKDILQFLSLNPRFIIERGFKSRTGYNGLHTVYKNDQELLYTSIKLKNLISQIFFWFLWKFAHYGRPLFIFITGLDYKKKSFEVWSLNHSGIFFNPLLHPSAWQAQDQIGPSQNDLRITLQNFVF